ncbi:hypothetical protein ACH5RR_018978 [Cinchona calisaya]|uniref:Methyltransferase-like protein 13 n=1 Tax=Cinchona calisaya TaxID=153742 RepID=A0ABD2ZN06_9GENT
MSVDPTTFETIVPSRYLTFAFPNPYHDDHLLPSPLLRISVLDSPSTTTTATPKIAAMLVPFNRQHDWTFSTKTGHLQLLLSFPHLSRLILISNHSTSTTLEKNPSQIEENLLPLLLALTPKSAFQQNNPNGFPEIPFLSYEDEVISSVVLEICDGNCVGEMLVENVELQELGNSNNNGREFRRRLRFKRMPNLIQTQVRIHPVSALDDGFLEGVEFRVDNGVLVQPYLSPMVAGLVVISSYLNERIRCGFRPKALCLGVGGGALVRFLSDELGLEVVGVEEDEVVLRVGKKYFDLRESDLVRLCVGDGIELIQKLAFKGKDCDGERWSGCGSRNSCCLDNVDGSKFDVVMVDMDTSDASMGTSAPPLEFFKRSVLLAAREVICDHGVVIVNVIPLSMSFYEMVVTEFQEVLVASASKLRRTASGDYENSFHQKLKASIQGSYVNSVRKISRDSVAK